MASFPEATRELPGSAPHEQPVILSMQHITKRFPGVVALDDVTFDVRAGEVHCLVGENGAGKSTLMNIMSGVYTGYEGTVELSGHPVTFHNTREAQHAGCYRRRPDRPRDGGRTSDRAVRPDHS